MITDLEPAASQHRMYQVARRAIRNPLSSREVVKAALMMLATSTDATDALLRDKARVMLWPEYQGDLASDVQRRVNRLNKAARRAQSCLELVAAFVAGGLTMLVSIWVLL